MLSREVSLNQGCYEVKLLFASALASVGGLGFMQYTLVLVYRGLVSSIICSSKLTEV